MQRQIYLYAYFVNLNNAFLSQGRLYMNTMSQVMIDSHTKKNILTTG